MIFGVPPVETVPPVTQRCFTKINNFYGVGPLLEINFLQPQKHFFRVEISDLHYRVYVAPF